MNFKSKWELIKENFRNEKILKACKKDKNFDSEVEALFYFQDELEDNFEEEIDHYKKTIEKIYKIIKEV